MKEYRPRLADEASTLDQEADKKFVDTREANSQVDRYTILTVMLASGLFFGGLATHFTSARVQIGVLLFGLFLFLASVTILIGTPVA
jgi:hypothetical protein